MTPLLERDIHLFDLDNTLYHPDNRILEQIGDRMRQYVAQHFGISHEAANELCFRYYRQYGGTIRGLQLHHPEVDLDEFSEFSHQVELAQVQKATALKKALKSGTHTRYVFTNSPLPYAERLLKHLDLTDCFDGIFSVELTGYQMKPNPHAFHTICRHFEFDASNAVMYDDQPDNLATAKNLGMRTVLVNREDLKEHDACYRTEALPEFVSRLKREK